MGKNKLARFAENLTFTNLFQVSFEDIQSQDFELKGKWREVYFKNNNPIVLELGCGKGEYTVGLAKKYPNKNFIGIDIKGARLWRGCKTAFEDKMNNVAFLRTHIQLLEKFFDKDEVDEIWITFCDPQPNNENRRLTCERFLNRYAQVIKPDGVLHLKTDSKELFDYTFESLQNNNHGIIFANDDLYASDYEGDAKDIQTFYEKMFLNEGKKITYIKFKL